MTSAVEPELRTFYEQAWGKEWPRSTATISYSDISAGYIDKEQLYGPLARDVENAGEQTYVYLRGIEPLQIAIGVPNRVCPVLVVLSEYNRLLEKMEEEVTIRGERAAFVVTGHPGIGMYTVLILDVDLTAIHTSPSRKDYFSLIPTFVPPYADYQPRFSSCQTCTSFSTNRASHLMNQRRKATISNVFVDAGH